jgi:hypothetical protein
MGMDDTPIVHFFSSVAHVWVYTWSKNYWADCEKVFLKSNFYVSESFKFQCDPFSNKKDVSQTSSCRQWGLSEIAYFIFGYFSTNLGTSVDGNEKNNNLKVSLKSPNK